MEIRSYQPGDESRQIAIYNFVAASWPGFKPATKEEHLRRILAPSFDPNSRLYAIQNQQIVGYISTQSNGRISYPWCLPGHEAAMDLLLHKALESFVGRKVFVAYPERWSMVWDFFGQRGFHKAREILNFAQSLAQMPTNTVQRPLVVTPLSTVDLSAMLQINPGWLPFTETELEAYIYHNSLFSAESFFAIRNRDGSLQAVGFLNEDPQAALATRVDPNMSCFRTGAFGTEGMTTKRIRGLFSVLVPEDKPALAYDLLQIALQKLERNGIMEIAGQISSDQPHLVEFYRKYFQLQGQFPIYERMLI